MNILIAKVIVQSFIDESLISLPTSDEKQNFFHVLECAEFSDEDEVIEALETIKALDMLHIFKGGK